MLHVTERRRPFGDDVPLHCMGRSWSRWSTQSGGVPSSSHESYSTVKRKVYTCTLQVLSIHGFYILSIDNTYSWSIQKTFIRVKMLFFFANFVSIRFVFPSNKCTSFKQIRNLEILIIMSSCLVVFENSRQLDCFSKTLSIKLSIFIRC